jgi:hypothetical protein
MHQRNNTTLHQSLQTYLNTSPDRPNLPTIDRKKNTLFNSVVEPFQSIEARMQESNFNQTHKKSASVFKGLMESASKEQLLKKKKDYS